MIFVTHDQEEALSMADRIALLHNGRLRQLDTPQRMYRQPADAFVADFIGRTNFLPLVAPSPAGHPHVAGFAQPSENVLTSDAAPAQSGKFLGVRPEHARLHSETAGYQPCIVIETAFAGAMQSVLVEAGGNRLTIDMPTQDHLWQSGDRASLQIAAGTCRVYDTNH